MSKIAPRGKIDLRLWSVNTPLRDLAGSTGLAIHIHHEKGGLVELANGKLRASKACRHYVAFENSDLNTAEEASQRIDDILTAIRGTELARLIASDTIEAEIDLAAFHGEIDWEGQIDPKLIAAAHAANVRIVVEHYDKFTDKGAPLAVYL